MSTTRREFLKQAGGIAVLLTVDVSALFAERPQFRSYPTDLNAYLRIGEDGRVSLFTGKIEMGQGVHTSLPMMLAEELDVPLSRIDPVMGDTDLCPWDMGTFGSMTTRFFGPPMRRAAAEAKQVLKELASDRLGVPVDRLGTRDGTVYDTNDPATSVSYAELAGGARIEREVRGEVSLDAPEERTVAGVPTERLDARAKVTGAALFTADVRVDGMLAAALLRPPAHGARLLEVDTAPAEAVDGVRVVRDGDLVAALHRHPDVAREARDRMQARWEEPSEGPSSETIFAYLRENLPPARVVTEAGELARGRRDAVHVVEATYRAHYIAHAPMEPHAALARVEGRRATIWASTQTPFPLRSAAAELLGVPEENVRVLTPFVGGGFGGKTENLQALEAVRLSRLAGVPVQVAWSRREEFFQDTFRPATMVDTAAGVDDSGHMTFWDYANMHGGDRSSTPIYDLPNHRVTAQGGWSGEGPRYHPLQVGAWRGPGANVNHFAMESQVDDLARVAGMDPVSFRMANLTDERMRRVLSAALEAFGHDDWRPAPSGAGVGIALGTDAGAYVAAVARVRVDEASGRVEVERILCAQDCGEIVNPEGCRMQIEGGLIQGLGYTLAEEIRFDRGAIFDENFDSYAIPRFSWLPDVESVLVPSPELGPQGGGEPSVTLVGAVVANAVHDATGARVRELPMTPRRVREALARG